MVAVSPPGRRLVWPSESVQITTPEATALAAIAWPATIAITELPDPFLERPGAGKPDPVSVAPGTKELESDVSVPGSPELPSR